MSNDRELGVGIALSLAMIAAAGVYNTVQDRRPANVCAVSVSGGVDVTQTETRSLYHRGNVEQTFQISADETGKMFVTVLEPPIDNDLFQGPLTTRRWQDNIAGSGDNLVKDYQEARTLVRQCAATLQVKLSEAPTVPSKRFADTTVALKK